MIGVQNIKEILKNVYGDDEIILKNQLSRYNKIMYEYNKYFENENVYLFSTPGRTEISGNHTDHNLGRVIAASIDLDSIAVISKNDDNKINLYSEGYDNPFEIDLCNLIKVDNEEGTTNSLIRGIAARFAELGHEIGGFNGVISSDVLLGSGLSSSASIEVLLGSIFNTLFNKERIDSKELAIIGQWAENNYFGKPCGLMDQMACAVGGIISIDLEDHKNPKVEKVEFDFEKEAYKLLIVDTGGNHEDLTEDYSSIPREMKSVANIFGKEVCREIDESVFLSKIKEIREKVGDRAVLRAFHYFNENERVKKQINSLKRNDFKNFLKFVNESGNSSLKWLQNIYPIKNVKVQGVGIALAFTEKFIKAKGEGACRIHGGGFAGTIQVFLPNKYVDDYRLYMEPVIGIEKVMVLNIRPQGTICLKSQIKL